MIPDAHCHLSLLPDPDAAVEEAARAGVGPILAVSMDADEAEAVLALRDRHRGAVLAGAGLHPTRVVELAPDLCYEHLRRVIDLSREADFVGEIGLDHKDARTDSERARQREVLAALLETAERLRRPVNLHTRRADRELLDAAVGFHGRTGLGTLLHWFTHSAKLAKVCAAEGVFISPGPSILIDDKPAAVAGAIDPRVLLVETDAPVTYGSLGPARPAWARRVAGGLAGLRGVSERNLDRSLTENLRRYLSDGAERSG